MKPLEFPATNGVSRPSPHWGGQLIDRAVAADVPAAWVAGDEVYGADPTLRAAIRGHRLGYVLAIAANRYVPTPAGKIRVDRLPAMLPKRAWQKHSAGAGSHGQRYYSWAWVELQRRGRHRHRLPPFADPPQRQHRRTRLPALLQSTAGHAAHPGHRRRSALAHRRILPSRQRPHRARPASGPALDAPGTAGPPWPCSPTPSWPSPPPPNATPPRTPAGLITLTVNEFRRLFDALLLVSQTHHHQPAGLVTMATTTPTPSPPIPLPTPRTTNDHDLLLQY